MIKPPKKEFDIYKPRVYVLRDKKPVRSQLLKNRQPLIAYSMVEQLYWQDKVVDLRKTPTFSCNLNSLGSHNHGKLKGITKEVGEGRRIYPVIIG